ncbi:MAG: hypothetical protein E6Q97_26635, partial [Desulfurellales bacterium]
AEGQGQGQGQEDRSCRSRAGRQSRLARILFVGQAPGPKSIGSIPFEGSYSGRRLASLMGVSIQSLFIEFDFLNLLDKFPGKDDSNHPRGDAFPLSAARKAARQVTPTLRARRVVLLGRNVADAFEIDLPWLEWRRRYVADSGVILHSVAVCPHPSGVSHWWNNRENRIKAEAFFRSAPFLK